jgi:hypothetical protein
MRVGALDGDACSWIAEEVLAVMARLEDMVLLRVAGCEKLIADVETLGSNIGEAGS